MRHRVEAADPVRKEGNPSIISKRSDGAALIWEWQPQKAPGSVDHPQGVCLNTVQLSCIRRLSFRLHGNWRILVIFYFGKLFDNMSIIIAVFTVCAMHAYHVFALWHLNDVDLLTARANGFYFPMFMQTHEPRLPA